MYLRCQRTVGLMAEVCQICTVYVSHIESPNGPLDEIPRNMMKSDSRAVPIMRPKISMGCILID